MKLRDGRYITRPVYVSNVSEIAQNKRYAGYNDKNPEQKPKYEFFCSYLFELRDFQHEFYNGVFIVRVESFYDVLGAL